MKPVTLAVLVLALIGSSFAQDHGGYHECAVCANEQPETFVDVCQICKQRIGNLVIKQPKFAPKIRLGYD
jgi:hypothetical protein